MRVLQAVSTNELRKIIRFAIGLSAGLVGVADMLSVIVPRLNWNILLGAWPINVHLGLGEHKLTVVVGFLLVMLSYGLMRGKLQAWRITLMLSLLSFFLHLLHGGAIFITFVPLGLALMLLVLASYFQARSDPPSVKRGYIALILGVGIVVFYTIGGFFALYDQFEPLVDRVGIEEVLVRLFIHLPLDLLPGTRAFFFDRALPVLCLSAVLYGMIMILRPVAATLLPNEKERQKVERLIRRYGTNSISYFALNTDKAYFFSASGKSVISYVLEGNVAVVAGDPIGPQEEMMPVIQQFIAFCNEQDWTIVFWQVRDELAELYRKLGLHLLKIGEDAIIDTSRFTLKGGAMANVRTSAKRAEKEGVRVLFYRGQIDDAEYLAQMGQISRLWLAKKGGCEMAFSMGRFDMMGDEEQLSAVAVDTNNRVQAFVTFVPIYGRCGWGLDLLRRAECCVPGTMELLLACSIEYLKDCGAEMVSLGLAPLSNVQANDASLLDSSLDFLTQHFGNLEKSSSLFNFKKKFSPEWESRYLVFSNTLTLPKIGWALYKAHQDDASMLRTLRKSLLGWKKGYAQGKKTVTGALETLRV